MYVEMLGNLILKQGSLLEVGKVYNIRHFSVAHAKSSYKVTSAPVMIYFTLYSIIEVCKKASSMFHLYVYELSSYDSISPYGPNILWFRLLLLLLTIH
jgi:hypothetical protein